MDAQAHLLSLGWAGPGHPLHPSAYKQKGHRGLAYDSNSARTSFSNTSNGLIKPLLVSQKQGRLGIGRKAHEPQAGNEWWLKGFEKALGDVGKSESERSSGTSTPVREAGVGGGSGKVGALYSFFVRGGMIEGTIGEEQQRRGRKRKSDVLEDDAVEVGEEEREFEQIADFMAVRDQDEKRRERQEKISAEQEFKAVRAFMEVREGKRKNSKSERLEVADGSAPLAPAKGRKKRKSDQPDLTTDSLAETEEERRERRRRRREEKEARKALELKTNGNVHDDDDAAAKALRRAEKKRGKAEKAGVDASR